MESIKQFLQTQYSKADHLRMRLFKASSLIKSQQTPYTVIATFTHTSIRYYAANERRYQEPIVFVAPLAINMAIYDLFPYRSLIGYFQKAGFEVYLIDWGQLSYRDRHLSFSTIISQYLPECIQTIRQHAHSEQITLHGWSMAGLFVLLCSAINQPNYVKNLIVLGSPIDSYASGRLGKIYSFLHRNLSWHKKLQQIIYRDLPTWLTHSPGFINALGFKLIDPKGWLNSYVQLFQHLDDKQDIIEHATMGHFLHHMIDYPGAIIQDMLFNICLPNPLKHGSIQLNNKTIDLAAIQSALLIGAGQNDRLVSVTAMQPLTQLTSSRDVTFTIIPGGHIGLMSSQASALAFWPVLKQWLIQRSTPFIYE